MAETRAGVDATRKEEDCGLAGWKASRMQRQRKVWKKDRRMATANSDVKKPIHTYIYPLQHIMK
jgi:hypothetical protein